MREFLNWQFSVLAGALAVLLAAKAIGAEEATPQSNANVNAWPERDFCSDILFVGAGCWWRIASGPLAGCAFVPESVVKYGDMVILSEEKVDEVTWNGFSCRSGTVSGNGRMELTYENVGHMFTGAFVDGYQTGYWVNRKEWYSNDNGSITGWGEASGMIDSGKRTGHWTTRRADGSTSNGMYQGGRKVGVWLVKEHDGSFRNRTTYTSDGYTFEVWDDATSSWIVPEYAR